MRHNFAESMSGKFGEVLQQYQRAQTDYGEKIKAKMVQKVKIGTFLVLHNHHHHQSSNE